MSARDRGPRSQESKEPESTPLPRPGGINLDPDPPEVLVEEPKAKAPAVETITREKCPHCSATQSLIGGPKTEYRIIDSKNIHWCANCRHPGTLLDPAANERKKKAVREKLDRMRR